MPNGQYYPPPPPPPPGYGGQPPPSYPPPPGYGGPPPGYRAPPPPMSYELGIGESLQGAFEVYKNNFGAFFAFWAIPAILGIILGLLPTIIFGTPFGTVPDTGGGALPDFGFLFAALGMTLLFAIVASIIQILFTGGLIGMTKEAMSTQVGKTITGTGFTTIRKYFGAILITAIVVNVLIAIGFILCCIPGILFCYWWMFAVTVVVVEGVGLSEGMARSKEFAETRHTFWFAVVLIIAMFVVNLIASTIASTVSVGVTIAAGDIAGSITSSVISGIFSWFIAPFFYIAIAYHYIKGRGLGLGGPPMQGAPPPPGPGMYPPPPPPRY